MPTEQESQVRINTPESPYKYVNRDTGHEWRYVPGLRGMWVQAGHASYDRDAREHTLIVSDFRASSKLLHLPLLPKEVALDAQGIPVTVNLEERALEVVSSKRRELLDMIRETRPNCLLVEAGWVWRDIPERLITQELLAGYEVLNYFHMPKSGERVFNPSSYKSGHRMETGAIVFK